MRLSTTNLDVRLGILNFFIKKTEDSLSTAPEGYLRIVKGKNGPSFYHVTDRRKPNGKYISVRNIDLVKRLAQKEYDLKVLRKAHKERNCLLKLIGRYNRGIVEDTYGSLPQIKQTLVEPVILTDEEYVRQWLEKPFETKGFSENDPIITNDRGMRFRSKSEALSSNRYDIRGIPYRYEEPLFLEGFGMVYPDFKLLNVRYRKEFLHEHLGKMDDPEYAEENVRKIKAYQYNGWILGKNLIITMETRKTPLNPSDIDFIIDKYLI